MEVTVIKTADDGELTKETVTVTGVPESELEKGENWKHFKGHLVERTEKQIPIVDKNTQQKKTLTQVIYNDAPDERGAQMMLEVWSPTDDGILSADHTAKRESELYYEVIKNDYGVKFKVKAIKLEDGTWSAPKAKSAWKKGSMVNNRALAMQAAAGLFQGGGGDDKVIEEVIATADKLYEWINKA